MTGLKTLVIRFSSIGDIVFSTSVLETLVNQFPGVEITYLTLSQFSPILQGHPQINSLKTLEKSASVNDIRELGRKLSREGFDLVLDIHNTLRAKILRSTLRASRILVLKKPRWKRFLLTTFHWNIFPPGFSYRHLLHRPLNPILPKNFPIAKSRLFITESENRWLTEFLLNKGIPASYIAIVPGAAWPTKQWDRENYRVLIQRIVSEMDVSVLILGGPKDTICDDIDIGDPKVFNLRGLTSLHESLRILSGAKRVLGSDTGLVHAAEALQVPVVLLLGPTTAETGAGIELDSSIVIENTHTWCRPCSQNGSRPCYRATQVCLTEIKPELVYESLENSV